MTTLEVVLLFGLAYFVILCSLQKEQINKLFDVVDTQSNLIKKQSEPLDDFAEKDKK